MCRSTIGAKHAENVLSLFVIFRNEAAPARRISPTDTAGMVALVRGTPDLRRGMVYTPVDYHDPYLDDGPGPILALQLEFDTLAGLEKNLVRGGYLQMVADPVLFPSLAGATAIQQAMLTRRFPVPRPRPLVDGAKFCTYLVEYPGAATDYNAWLTHYVMHHPQLMAKFPDIRQAEIYTPATIISALPFPFIHRMQRNKVVFDDQQSLNASLVSEVRHEMRRDFENFPAFTGSNLHAALDTVVVVPAGDGAA
jgi:hypothetical protein